MLNLRLAMSSEERVDRVRAQFLAVLLMLSATGCSNPPACATPIGDPPRFEHGGVCWDQTPACCTAADCPTGYFGCDEDPVATESDAPGRCRVWDACFCASDSDCELGDRCVTNQRFCGACIQVDECVTDDDCDDDRICVESRCTAVCD